MKKTMGYFMQPPRHEDVVDAKVIQPTPILSQPAKLPPEPAPVLSQPAAVQFQEPPTLRIPATIVQQPTPALSSPMANAADTLQTVPVLSQRMPVNDGKVKTDFVPLLPANLDFQVAPPLRKPDVIDLESAPKLSVPAVIEMQAAPKLSTTASIAFEPAPTLRVPNVIPFQEAPPLRTTASIPFQEAPILRTTATIEFQSAPALRTPSVIPFQSASTIHLPREVVVSGSDPHMGIPGDILNPDFDQTKHVDDISGSVLISPFTGSDVKHSDIISANTKSRPGSVGHTLNDIGTTIKGMLSNIDIPAQAVITIPSMGGMAPIPLPLDIDINTHGGKINAKIDIHAKQAATTIAQAGITYGKQKAQAVLTSGLNVLTGGLATPTIPFNPTGKLSAPNQSSSGILAPEAQAAPYPANKVKIPDFYVNAKDPAFPYNSDARVKQQVDSEVAALDLDKKLNKNKYNENSQAGLFQHLAQSDKPQQSFADALKKYNSDYNPTAGGHKKDFDIENNQFRDVATLSEVIQANPVDEAQQTHLAVAKRAATTSSLAAINAKQDIEKQNRYSDVVGAEGRLSKPDASDLRKLNDPTTGSRYSKQVSLTNLFSPPDMSLSGEQTPSVAVSSLPSDVIITAFENPSATIASTKRGVVEKNGFFSTRASSKSPATFIDSTPSDDETYVPLIFTDMRPLAGSQYRSVFFRPFITGLSEEYSPAWNLQNYFGRVDKVATYQSTDRTINLSFKVVCFEPADLETNYQKLAWLTSMVYPQYDGSKYQAGPVIKMRVGDVINAVGGNGVQGISGIITSLNYSYDDSTWELLNGRRLPKNVEVSLGFHVLHEYAVGRVGDKFGGIGNGQVDITRIKSAFGKSYLGN